MKKFLVFISLSIGLAQAALAIDLPQDQVVDIWARIPFVRGADLCRFKDAYTQTRTEHINKMIENAERLMFAGATGIEAIQMLQGFNDMYDRNLDLAVRNLDKSLETSLYSYVDSFYRQYRPKVKKLNFMNLDDLAGRQGQEAAENLDYIAHGSYTLAPNCEGNVQVTLHLVGRDRRMESFIAIGKPEYVMSKIASELFTKIQRTQFPAVLRTPEGKQLTIVGTMNGSVDKANSHRQAEKTCQTLDARLPTADELELADSYGDWSGGVSVGKEVWFLPSGMVYAPHLRNPTPVRNFHELNPRAFSFYCVK